MSTAGTSAPNNKRSDLQVTGIGNGVEINRLPQCVICGYRSSTAGSHRKNRLTFLGTNVALCMVLFLDLFFLLVLDSFTLMQEF